MAKIQRQHAEIQEKTTGVTPASSDDVLETDRAARLRQLKAAIEAGTYEIRGSDLVDKLTRDLTEKARR